GRRFEEAARRLCVREERQHLGRQRRIVAAGAVDERLALGQRPRQRRLHQLVETGPAIGAHHGPPLESACRSQSFANRQSRKTVSTDTTNTAAVSSTVSPPKNRSSTT